MNTITTNTSPKNVGTLLGKAVAGAKEFLLTRVMRHEHTGYEINKNFPTIILTDTRGKSHTETTGAFRTHFSHDMLKAEKPTWAQWRTQMTNIKKAHRVYEKRSSAYDGR